MKNGQERNEALSKEGNGKDLNLYAMSKEGLIKKVQVLMHELAIYRRYEQEKGRLDKMDKVTVQKELVEKEIIIAQMKKNESIVQNTLKSKIKELQTLQLELKQKETTVLNLKKQNDILKKQLSNIQKTKSKEFAQKFNAEIRQAKERIDNLQKENKQLKKTMTQLTNKVKILIQINRETEQKLAQSIVTKKSFKENITQTQKQDFFPENKENQDPNKHNNFKLQNLALKQQIRVLKQELRLLQQSKELLRVKFQERELLYSRMLPLKS